MDVIQNGHCPLCGSGLIYMSNAVEVSANNLADIFSVLPSLFLLVALILPNQKIIEKVKIV